MKSVKMVKTVRALLAGMLILTMLLAVGCASEHNEDPPLRFSEVSDFKNKTLGTVVGTYIGELAENVIGGIECRYYESAADLAFALKNKDIDGIVYDLPINQYLREENPEFEMFPDILAEDYYGFVQKKNSPYTAEISKVIEDFKQDGTLEALRKKWVLRSEGEPYVDYSKYNLEDRGNGILRCNYDPVVPPFAYLGGDASQPQGFEVELIYKIADKLNKGVEFKNEKLDSLLLSIEKGEADIAFGSISITEERKESVDFAASHYAGGVSILCRRENISLSGKQDLNSDEVSIAGAFDAIAQELVAEKYPKAKFVGVNNENDGYLALSSGKVDAFVVNRSQYEAFLAANSQTSIQLHKDGSIGGGKVVVPISPKTEIPHAKGLLDTFLSQAKKDGVLDEMEKRWTIDKDYTMPTIKMPENPKFKITVGTTALAVPYTFIKEDRPCGFDVELAYRFAQWCGADIEFKTYSWDGVVLACKNGEVDYVFSNIFDIPEHREAMEMSEPYLTFDMVVLVNSGDPQGVAPGGFWKGILDSINKTFVRESRWKMIVRGLLTTLEILLASMVLGTLLGFLVCAGLCSKNKIVSGLGKLYCCLLGRIPSMVILLISNFIVFSSEIFSPVVVSILTFSVMFSANVGEIMSTGISSIDKGQYEAALSLGFGKFRAFRKVIVPQAIEIIMPHYKGAVVSLLMLTAIVGYISIEDLTRVGDLIRSRTYEAFFPLITTALIYFIIATLIIFWIGRIETRAFARKNRLKGVCPVERAEKADKGTQRIASKADDILISVSNLKKQYESGDTPLIDVNTTVHRGEVITVIGPSGTGKSTLLRCINRLETPTSGKIGVFGQNICDKKTDLTVIRRRMGMVFQSFHLFPHLSVVENVMLAPMNILKQPKQEAYETALRLLKSVGVAEKALAYPDEFSGGQKQRVAIARTLAMNPEIILFDEPTSALDPAAVGEVLAVIRGLANEGYTIMIVTHEMKFAKNASSRIFYMDEGIIYEDGPPEVIFNSPKKIKTRAFVHGLKVLSLTIDSPEYDFIALAEKIRWFGEKNRLDARGVDNLYRTFDEICAMGIVPQNQGDYALTVVVEYSEEALETTMRFTWGGEAKNPLENTEDLSVILLKNFIKNITYRYEGGENILTALI